MQRSYRPRSKRTQSVLFTPRVLPYVGLTGNADAILIQHCCATEMALARLAPKEPRTSAGGHDSRGLLLAITDCDSKMRCPHVRSGIRFAFGASFRR
jgi:hypothetical protein